jgi:peptidoglycan/LPS O-acetylase OafA/YrhL
VTATVAARPVVPAGGPALRRFRPDIEGLRAVAVVTVVLAHAGLALPGGFVGVDVFFVISGFLITRQLVDELDARGRVDLARFYARRCRRILPAATLVLLVTLLACWWWLSPLRVPAVTLDAALAAVSGVNWRLGVTGTDYFAATTAPSPFQHYWSLSVEEQFYLVWPLLLVASALLLGRAVGRTRAVVGVLAVVIAGSFGLSVVLTATAAPLAYFGSHTRAWELALGALVAVTARRWARLPGAAAAALTWLGLGLIALAAVGFTEAVPYPGSLAAVPVLGAALVVAGGCAAPRGGAEVLLRLPPMQVAGRYSYSWYLWHWPLLLLLPVALGRGSEASEAEAAPDPVLALVAVVASFGLAAATHRWVEEPFRRDADLVRFPQRAIMIGTGLVAVSVAAAVAVSAAVVVPGSASGVAAPSVALTPAAVVEATRATALPGNLRPALESALRDQADTRTCFDDYFATEPDTGPGCVFGDPAGTRTMVLLGDSHAAQWAGPVFAWAEQNGWRVQFMAKSSCQPGVYPDYVVPALQRVYTECNQWRAAAFDFVAATRPEMVVLGSLAKGVTITPDGMAEAVEVLRGSGARVLYIADNPYMGIDPPACLAEHPQDVQRCSVPRGAASVEAPARLAQIEGALVAGAEVWDPVPYLCAEVCPSVIGDIGVYKDENHITNTFATSLLPRLGPVLAQLAGG